MIDQFCFLCEAYLYDQSCSFPILLWSESTPDSIDHEVQYHFRCRAHLYNQSCHCPLLFSSQTAPGLIDHNSSVLFSLLTALVQSVTWLPCLVFVINCTWSDMSQQFSFGFGLIQNCTIGHGNSISFFDVKRIYTINHVYILYGFHHSWYSIQLIMTVQYHLYRRSHLY